MKKLLIIIISLLSFGFLNPSEFYGDEDFGTYPQSTESLQAEKKEEVSEKTVDIYFKCNINCYCYVISFADEFIKNIDNSIDFIDGKSYDLGKLNMGDKIKLNSEIVQQFLCKKFVKISIFKTWNYRWKCSKVFAIGANPDGRKFDLIKLSPTSDNFVNINADYPTDRIKFISFSHD